MEVEDKELEFHLLTKKSYPVLFYSQNFHLLYDIIYIKDNIYNIYMALFTQVYTWRAYK